MILAWFRNPKLTVEVLGADIVVTMPGTSCRVVYTRTEDNKLSYAQLRSRGQSAVGLELLRGATRFHSVDVLSLRKEQTP